MKERPILFSTPMVRAILEGRKTQTRRVVKLTDAGRVKFAQRNWHLADPNAVQACPFGQPGDRLWVRETFQPIFAEGVDYEDADWETGKGYSIRYVATDGIEDWVDPDDNTTNRCMPSIHMPRWASRITLEIEDIRVERLLDIDIDDIAREGLCETEFMPTLKHAPISGYIHGDDHEAVRCGFKALWESINGPGSWDLNPWVWVVEFKRLEGVR